MSTDDDGVPPRRGDAFDRLTRATASWPASLRWAARIPAYPLLVAELYLREWIAAVAILAALCVVVGGFMAGSAVVLVVSIVVGAAGAVLGYRELDQGERPGRHYLVCGGVLMVCFLTLVWGLSISGALTP